MTFYQYTRLRRLEAGITLNQLAEKLDFCNPSDVSRRETGHIHWRFDEVVKLAQVYGQSASEFIAQWEQS